MQRYQENKGMTTGSSYCSSTTYRSLTYKKWS